MSPSSDIETLFGHFGGNAGDYQEIGRENEASTARTRWPLLVTLDLKQPSIPAIVQRRDPVSKQTDDAAQTQADESDKPDAAAAAAPALTGPALLRSKAPLFARSHRRNIPPVANVVKADAPRGAERFSALPQVADPQVVASQAMAPVAAVAAPAASIASAPPVAAIAPIAPIVPVAAPRAPGFASIARMSATPPVLTPVAPAATAPVAAQPASILGQLFKPAARSTPPVAAQPQAQGAAAPLASIFDRLRGETPAAATPAPNSWLTNGPRRS